MLKMKNVLMESCPLTHCGGGAGGTGAEPHKEKEEIGMIFYGEVLRRYKVLFQ